MFHSGNGWVCQKDPLFHFILETICCSYHLASLTSSGMSTAMEAPGTGMAPPTKEAAAIQGIRFLSSPTFASSTSCDLSFRLRTEIKEEISVISNDSLLLIAYQGLSAGFLVSCAAPGDCSFKPVVENPKFPLKSEISPKIRNFP